MKVLLIEFQPSFKSIICLKAFYFQGQDMPGSSPFIVVSELDRLQVKLRLPGENPEQCSALKCRVFRLEHDFQQVLPLLLA